MLAYLAVESERAHRREILAALLWPEEPEQVANNNFRQTLSSLRKAIGDRPSSAIQEKADNPVLLVTRETVQFNSNSDYWLDVREFLEIAADTDSSLDEAVRLNAWSKAVALYHGDFLEGFFVRDSAVYEDWMLLTRDRLQRQVVTVLQHLVEIHTNQKAYERACTYAWRWVEFEPWQEDAYQHLMLVLALHGQRTTALAQYEACRTALRQEFGVEPSEQTLQLFEHIRDGNLNAPVPLMPVYQSTPSFPYSKQKMPVFVAREQNCSKWTSSCAIQWQDGDR